MNAIGIGLPVVGDGWCRMEIGEDGDPQGVCTFRVAASENPGSDWIPVPPITAMWTGSMDSMSYMPSGFDNGESGDEPSYVLGTPAILRYGIVTDLEKRRGRIERAEDRDNEGIYVRRVSIWSCSGGSGAENFRHGHLLRGTR
jgi:hypothetical protein